MEGDSENCKICESVQHFNPLPLHGGRLRKLQNLPIGATFQSTPSAWRETSSLSDWELKAVISIHSLRMEGDISQRIVCVMVNDFNPLPPHGGRPELDYASYKKFYISIHSLRMEGDNFNKSFNMRIYYFNPLPPHGGRHPISPLFLHLSIFQSTPSAWRETARLSSSTRTVKYFNPLPPHGGRPHS